VRSQPIVVVCLALAVTAGCFEPSTQPAEDAGGAGGADAGGADAGGAGTGGTGGTGGTAVDAGSEVACMGDDDCGWGEIDHEILTPADCICLFGCPFIPLNTQTVERRLEQHAALCNPRVDGSGQPCPIDDCAMPSPAVCAAGSCAGEPFGGP
jgi:hypothetical protein